MARWLDGSRREAGQDRPIRRLQGWSQPMDGIRGTDTPGVTERR